MIYKLFEFFPRQTYSELRLSIDKLISFRSRSYWGILLQNAYRLVTGRVGDQTLNLSAWCQSTDLTHASLSFLPRFVPEEILKGGVHFANNQLCNMETIQWKDIVNYDNKPSMVLPAASKNKNCEGSTTSHTWEQYVWNSLFRLTSTLSLLVQVKSVTPAAITAPVGPLVLTTVRSVSGSFT